MANPAAGARVSAPPLSIDYPQQDEVIVSPEYTIRLSAPEDARKVEVCVNHGRWQACRPAVGHWWYDWSGYGEGEHEVAARCATALGRKLHAQPKEFFVAPRRTA